MRESSATLYSKAIQVLIQDGGSLSMYLKSSVYPKENPDAAVQKFLQDGVAPQDLTKALSQVFHLSVYDEVEHGPLNAFSESGWATNLEQTVFVVKNPFQGICPSRVIGGYASSLPTVLWPIEKTQAVSEMQDSDDNDCSQIIHSWLVAAVERQATDIHIVPVSNHTIRIFFRIHGHIKVFDEERTPITGSDSLYQRISNTLKSQCNLESGTYSKPQDGKFSFKKDACDVEVRLSMRPINILGTDTHAIFLRLLNTQSGSKFPRLKDLKLPTEFQELLLRYAQTNQNLVLISGPTGSGKSTTFYSALMEILETNPGKSIQTLEDPVEVHISGICQTQIREDRSMGFAEGIRSLMRTDVDVILIGEIRDEETAKLAVRAALTGHLVFGTIHCKSSVEVIGRLTDLGISPKLVADVLACSFAQRLIRVACQQCHTVQKYHEALAHNPALSPLSGLFNPDDWVLTEGSTAGCEHCLEGYRGRQVVAEALPFTQDLQYQIIAQHQEGIDQAAQHAITFWEHAKQLIQSRVTTVEECLRTLPQYIARYPATRNSQSSIQKLHFNKEKDDEKETANILNKEKYDAKETTNPPNQEKYNAKETANSLNQEKYNAKETANSLNKEKHYEKETANSRVHPH